MREDAPRPEHPPCEDFNALRWIVRAGSSRRYLPASSPPWQAVYRQARFWIRAGCFGDIVDDLRATLHEAAGKSPRSGSRAGYDGHKKNGSKVRLAVGTLGLLLAAVVTPADEKVCTLASSPS